MGSCTWGGPDPANNGQTMTSHFDFVVSFAFHGFPVSVGHGGDLTYYCEDPTGQTSYSSY